MPYININGIKEYYELSGSGYPMVFIHGFLGHGKSWKHQAGWFAKRYLVIVPDMRGHGKTDRPRDAASYSMEMLSSDIYELMKALNINKFYIVSHSWGARITTQFAVQHSEMLAGMVLISNSGETPKDVLPEETWLKMSSIMHEHGSINALLDVVENDSNVAIFYNYQGEKQGKMRSKLNGANAEAYAHAWNAFVDSPNMTIELSKLNIPVLFICGENDLPKTVSISRQTHILLPGSEYLLIKDVAHFPQDDAPDIVNKKIEEFLNNLEL